MFCVLNVKERDNSFFEKVFGSFIKDEYTVQTVPVFKGAPFYLLNVTVGKKGVSWESVISAVGKCASRLVTNRELTIPTNMNVGIYKSTVLYDKMMKNTFKYILDNNRLKNNPMSISVLDENAEYTEFTKQISAYASMLTVTTLCKEKYYFVCEEITDSTGLCPMLKSDFADAKIKIDAQRNVMTVNCNREYFNISEGCGFSVPQIYENLLPAGTEKYNFYSALYELCGVFSLGECVFDTITVNNEKKSVSDIHFS